MTLASETFAEVERASDEILEWCATRIGNGVSPSVISFVLTRALAIVNRSSAIDLNGSIALATQVITSVYDETAEMLTTGRS